MTQQTETTTQPIKQVLACLSGLFWGLLFTGIFIFLLTTTLTAYHKNQKLDEHAQQINEEIKQTQEGNRELEREIQALKSDPFYLEMVIRRELRMLKNNEIAITQYAEFY